MEKYPCGCIVMAGADRTNTLIECPVCHRMWSVAFNHTGWLECTPDREKEELHDRIAELEAECKRLSKLLSDKYLPSGMCVLERLVELTEENARLREALQAMYDLHPPSMFINFRDVDDWKKTLEQVGALLRREATDGTPDRTP